jgi:hypothetical protein
MAEFIDVVLDCKLEPKIGRDQEVLVVVEIEPGVQAADESGEGIWEQPRPSRPLFQQAVAPAHEIAAVPGAGGLHLRRLRLKAGLGLGLDQRHVGFP